MSSYSIRQAACTADNPKTGHKEEGDTIVSQCKVVSNPTS